MVLLVGCEEVVLEALLGPGLALLVLALLVLEVVVAAAVGGFQVHCRLK